MLNFKKNFIDHDAESVYIISVNLNPAKPTNFWGYANIQWGINNQVVDGYPDGTFKPNQIVEQVEF
ncbi:S-layer homology domain-containing protein [Paenibacillus sp. OAS669]|uniref:S-layer homology domain-containing protein n=1 Tax=Paenibacillus sp. OAS669 TaxID=2663821 RepID=UPI00178BEA02|nr:S-layer homology domain-containing protein [Paenibacillus sp. OAS669]MBE1441657.1 hypothetical protein [Paenibacillus sp. OAS669]